MLQKVQETKLQFKYYIPLIILMLRFNKPRDRQNWANPIRQYISTKSFNYSEHCFHQLVWVYFLLYMCKKRLLGSFNTAALHRLVRDFIEKNPQYHELYKIFGGGGGGRGYWAETTHQIRPKRPTLKSGRNNPGRNDPAETTYCRNDSCPKRPTAEKTRNHTH